MTLSSDTHDEIELKLASLGMTLPTRPTPIANFLPFRVAGNTVYLAGQTCERNGRVVHAGSVPDDVTFEVAREAAKLCALNLLACLREACNGRLDRVSRCLRVGGFVQAKPGFPRVPAVVDGASELFVALWGENGRHARTAVGVATLPQNAAVEVDAIFELRNPTQMSFLPFDNTKPR
jgi:enamine deaminase RidA (YjgF/YER057c/UK114 family)